jgi:manganese transport protein
MAPAMLIILLGINPMKALVLSQVCLSFALPAAVIPMMIITEKKELMGDLVNNTFTKLIGWLIAATILGLNIVLLYLTFTGNV